MLTDRSRKAVATCSALAIATALVAGPGVARAQSFQGTGNPLVPGSATITTPSPTETLVTVNQGAVVINWTGTPNVFQPANTTATFQRTGNDFTVLNRIMPTDPTQPAQINGTVLGRIASTTTVPGGTVFFYSPGGIIAGPTAVFDVGNLALTASDPVFDSGGNFISPTGTVVFQPANPGSRVELQSSGSQRTQVNGNLVALVAPTVINAGDINVTRAAALVSADAATITFNPNGLFDIVVPVNGGTSAGGQTLINSGTIGSTTASGNGTSTFNRVYMVAVPKNTAITMAITAGSRLGFNIANAADTVGNAVVLSAGDNVIAGEIAGGTFAGGTGSVNLQSASTTADINYTSDVRARASGNSLFTATNSTTRFAAGLNAGANLGRSEAFANTGGTLSFAQDVHLSASLTLGPGQAVTAGTATLGASNGGVITVGGNVHIEADAFVADSSAPGAIGTASGGAAQINLNNGGTIHVGGDVVVEADAVGGNATGPGVVGGNAVAGQAAILGFGPTTGAQPSTLTIGGNYFASAVGTGGNGQACVGCPVEGGSGMGGSARLQFMVPGSSVTVNGLAELIASGIGGSATVGTAGAGIGGRGLILGNGSTLVFGSDVLIDTRAFGGQHLGGGFGGNAFGSNFGDSGALIITQPGGGTITVAGDADLFGTALGGDSLQPGGTGGNATGKQAGVVANGGAISIGGVTSVDARGFGGSGAILGGDGFGGLAFLAANQGGSLDVGTALVSASGQGGLAVAAVAPGAAGGEGGDGIGGQAAVTGAGGGGNVTIVSLDIQAGGSGGNGGAGGGNLSGVGGTGGQGGSGSGGQVTIGAPENPPTPGVGSVSIATLAGGADGFGGDGGAGGSGVTLGRGGGGGDADNGFVNVRALTGNVDLGTAVFTATAQGGAGGIGSPDGLGGDAEIGGDGGFEIEVLGGGSLTGGSVSFFSASVGGTGSAVGASTQGNDETNNFIVTDGTVDLDSLAFSSTASQIDPNAEPDSIELTNATVDISGTFSFTTSADLTLALDNSALNVGELFLDARNVLLPVAAPATAGTITVAGNNSLTVAQDFRTFANFDLNGNSAIVAPGAFQVGNFTTDGALSVSAAGPIAFGNVTVGSLTADSGQDFTANAITAFNEIDVRAAGTVRVNGSWRSGSVVLTSNDLEIGTNGLITPLQSSQFSFFNIRSTNPNGAFIGDGLTGNGYTLSDAEFDRIRGFIDFDASPTAQDVDLTIGNLSIDGAQFGPDGGVALHVFDFDGDGGFSGRIRVNGNVAVTNIASLDEGFFLDFVSDDFELNTATGSISMSGQNNALAGTLEIDAAHIHVADEEILTKLRADPLYAGHVEELNAPARVQRPEGVLRAFTIDLEGEQTVYIQNTGTRAAPAGFLISADGDSDVTGEGDGEGALEVVINGQIQTESGILTGRQAFESARAGLEEDLEEGEEFGADLTATSTFNGCVILGDNCGGGFVEEDPIASISSEIELISQDTLEEEPFEESVEEDDEAEADEASSPIAPPAPLIDTRPLNPAVDVVEPVSGSGNPALIGSAVNETATEETQP